MMNMIVLLVLLHPLFGSSIPAADAAETTIALSDLDNPDWMPDQCTAAQRESLLTQWEKTEQAIETSPEDVAILYNRLGDQSYDVRQAASDELALLGAENLEALQRLSEEDDDLERTVRAKRIITQWREDRDKKSIRVRNFFRVWKASSHEQQLKYAKQLVTAIQKLPAQVCISEQPRAFGRRFGSPMPQQPTIRLHDELLPEIVTQLKSHKSPEAKRLLRSFLCENNTVLVLRTMQLIGSPHEDPDAAPELIRLAEGKNKTVALRALSHLSNWHGAREHRGEITAMLKRLYASKDEEVALQAAIISCYSGDWSGFPMLLEATKSPDKKIAMKAIGQLVDSRYSGRAKKVVPLLIPHLQTDDLNLLNRTIETLGNYKGTAKHILPFLQHEDTDIVWRTILALNSMEATEAIAPLEDLMSATTDDTTLGYMNEALSRLKRLHQSR